METTLMQDFQRSVDSVWSLAPAASTTLSIGPGPRVLQVCEGRLWLTTSGDNETRSTDVWLAAGDSIELPEGLRVVMEAWPAARFQLLMPPAANGSAGRGSRVLARAAAWVVRQLPGHGSPMLQSVGPYAG